MSVIRDCPCCKKRSTHSDLGYYKDGRHILQCRQCWGLWELVEKAYVLADKDPLRGHLIQAEREEKR